MLIVGCDFHTRFQQIAMLDPATGEVIERRLEHETGEAHKFYVSLPGAGQQHCFPPGGPSSAATSRDCRVVRGWHSR